MPVLDTVQIDAVRKRVALRHSPIFLRHRVRPIERKAMRARLNVLLWVLLLSSVARAQTDPLATWNDTPTKKTIIDFVQKVTTSGTPDYVPPTRRIAVFDQDGTLWSEQPVYFQLMFAADQIRKRASKHPDWKTKQPYAAAFGGGTEKLRALSKEDMVKLMLAAGDGLTQEEFTRAAREWLMTTKHPTRPQRIAELGYRPMAELITYLKNNDFRVFIVTGSDLEFVRAFSEALFNVPREFVVGTSVVTQYEHVGGEPQLRRTRELVVPVNDGPGKVVNIDRYIGLQPIFAFGNSDGDRQMLQYTTARSGPSLGLILHHDDAEREWAYDIKSPIGHLETAIEDAKKEHWIVVSMKKDFKEVFPRAE
jgi:phosphoserine phosphatase